MKLFYISFATDDGFLGATVIAARSATNALTVASAKGLNPGGVAAILPVPDNIPAAGRAEMLSYHNRLVTKAELMSRGAVRLGDLPNDMQDKFRDHATTVCKDHNQ